MPYPNCPHRHRNRLHQLSETPRLTSAVSATEPALAAASQSDEIAPVSEDDERRGGDAGHDDRGRCPVRARTGGKAVEPRTDPSETYRVSHTLTRNTPSAASAATGDSTTKTPHAVATPLPPRKPSQTGYM